MTFWQGFLVLTSVHVLAAASPGPDFVLSSQHTLAYGRKAGLLCSLGISLGLSVHILYSILGLATIIAQSVLLLSMVKLLGGAYLIYLGIQGLCSQQKTTNEKSQLQQPNAVLEMPPLPYLVTSKLTVATPSAGKSLLMGFMCNLLNPKAPIYFIALFTVVLSADVPSHWLLVYGGWMMLLQMAWFSLVVCLFSLPVFRRYLQNIAHWLDRVFGLAMVGLGIKVLRF